MLKRLKCKIGTLQLVSLLVTLTFLVIVLVTVSEKAATWITIIGGFIFTIIGKYKPIALDKMVTAWNGMDKPVHWGLLTIISALVIYLFGFFLRNYKFEWKITPKNKLPEITPS